jgi:hypothetical protein
MPVEELPLCVPYAARAGEWRLDAPWDSGPAEPHQYWEASPEEAPCRYLVASEADFVSCFRDSRVMLVGDSTARNLVMQLADFLGQCGSAQSAQRLGPDDPLAIQMCGQTFAALRAHGDVTVVTPPSLGNVTLDFKWAPYMADVTRVARAHLATPPAQGGADAVVVTLGYWTAKDAASAGGVGSAPVQQFLEELPRLVGALRDELAPTNPGLLTGHLVYGFAPYAEGKEANGGSHPRDVVDALNAGAAAALQPQGLPVFDGQWYTRVSAEALEKSNGKIVTWDGYHPAHAVVLTLMREHLSHFCALPTWRAHHPPALQQHRPPPAASASSAAHLLATPVGAAECAPSWAHVYSLPFLLILLGTLAVLRLVHCCDAKPPEDAGGEGGGSGGSSGK